MKKRIIITCLSCLITLTLSFSVTYAYLIAQDRAANTFTVADTKITVEEEFEPPKKLEPGVDFTKAPTVKNMGIIPCFVRMRADFSSLDAANFSEIRGLDTTNWIYNSTDDYYYYQHLLQPGDSTTALFTSIKIRNDASPAAMIDFDISVYAESVQHTDHNGACGAGECEAAFATIGG